MLGHPDEAIAQLRQAISFVPVPNRRPTFTRADEISGLTLLEVALRLDHVARASENLSLVDRGHLSRSVSVDLDLRALTTRQREALTVPQPQSGSGSGQQLLWIPVARQSRHHLSPVTMTDDGGNVVPRLTSQATAEVLIAGMSQLLRIQVQSWRTSPQPAPDPETEPESETTAEPATEQDTEPATRPRLGRRARWLIERGMAHLIRHGYHVTLSAPTSTSTDGESDAEAQLRALRDEADHYLRDLPDEYAAEFGWLLHVAVQEQLLIAMLPADRPQTRLTYEASLIPAVPQAVPIRTRLARLLWSRDDLTVTYRTQIPRIVRSYHLTVEAPADIIVRRFLLVTDADRPHVENLVHDLLLLADQAAEFGEPHGEVYRAELHDALARCAALARARHTNLIEYRRYLRQAFYLFHDRPPAVQAEDDGAGDLTADELIAGLCLGSCTFWHLRALAYHQERGALRRLADREDPAELATAPRTLARYLHHSQLVRDLSLDNDPRENGSHAHWANVELPFGPQVTEPVDAYVHLTLADERPALIESVSAMQGALVAVVGLLLLVLTPGEKGPFAEADAAVAVLLLVPGILISRLDLPSNHSVLGALRAYPRRIAVTSVAVTTGLAVAVAADAVHAIGYGWIAFALLVVLWVVCGAQIAARALHRRSLAPRSHVVPAWLLEALGLPLDRPAYPPDVQFDSIDGHLADERGDAADPESEDPESEDPESEDGGRGDVRTWYTGRLHRIVAWLEARSARTPRPGGGPSETALEEQTGQPVETVAFAARATASRVSGIAFTVAHRYPSPTRPHTASTFVAEEAAGVQKLDGRPVADSLFGFTAHGASYEVTADFVRDAAALESRDFVTSPLTDAGPPGHRSVSGVTRVAAKTPGALRNVNELLFQLGDRPDLSLQQSRMLGNVLTRLAQQVSETRAVPVSVHTPATPPSDLTRQNPALRTGTGPFVRMALSNSRGHGAARIAFEVAACALARELGLGLSLTEGRAGFGMDTPVASCQ